MISYPQLVPILLRKKFSEDPRGLGEFQNGSLTYHSSCRCSNWRRERKKFGFERFSAQEMALVAQLNSSLKRAHCCGIQGQKVDPSSLSGHRVLERVREYSAITTHLPATLAWNHRSGHRV